MAAQAPLVEIFDSIQGEGRFVGRPATFVRVATCPLRCLYCDTPNSYAAPASVPVRLVGTASTVDNPLSAERTAELIAAAGAVPEVSLTGGEPLVFPEFANALGVAVRGIGGRLHLETAAVDPAALRRCVAAIDHLSADYKLPATLGTPVGGPAVDAEGGYGERHVQCLEVALAAGVSIDCKLVLTAAVTADSFASALERLSPLRQHILLVLQPVTPFGAVTERLLPAALQRHLYAAQRAGFEARVLPQVHKALDLP